jgi:hypothetical protein
MMNLKKERKKNGKLVHKPNKIIFSKIEKNNEKQA